LDRLGTVAIMGVGLIGGSIGLAIRARGLARRVVGIGRDEGRLARARELGAIDAGTVRAEEGVAAADVVVVCTPVTRIVQDVLDAVAAGPPQMLVTDAGSTKRAIVEGVEADERACSRFVAAHPIAGSERSGVAFARADLFEGRTCVVVRTARTPPDRLKRAWAFWAALGCRVVEMDPGTHDRALALTSHLPHAVAASLAAAVPAGMLHLAAGAYRDGTRVAAADGNLWTGIFLDNRAALIEAMDAFQAELHALRDALIAGSDPAVRSWWDRARNHRSRFLENEIPGDPIP
jgi:prephenate dehydrogenase